MVSLARRQAGQANRRGIYLIPDYPDGSAARPDGRAPSPSGLPDTDSGRRPFIGHRPSGRLYFQCTMNQATGTFRHLVTRLLRQVVPVTVRRRAVV